MLIRDIVREGYEADLIPSTRHTCNENGLGDPPSTEEFPNLLKDEGYIATQMKLKSSK